MKRIIALALALFLTALLGGCAADNRSWKNLTDSQQQQVQSALDGASQEIADALNSMRDNLRGAASSDAGSDVEALEADTDLLLEKAQEIRIQDAEGNTVDTLQSKEERSAFIDSLAMDSWSPVELPDQARPAGRFVLEQEDTILAGQQDNDGQLHEVAALTLYQEDALVSLDVLGISMAFAVPEETHKAVLERLSASPQD